MFKTFTIDRGMDEMFISLYTKYKLKNNPLSIEKYLIEADPANVFVSAFYWVTNSRFGYDYWQDFQKRWDRYRAEKIDEYPMSDIRNFKGRGKSLRTNWDNAKFWHINGRLDTAERYGTELAKEELEQIANEYERVGYNPSTKSYTGTTAKDIRLASRELMDIENEKKSEDSATDFFGEFEIVQLEKVKSRRTLADDEASMNMRNRSGRILFNQKLTKEFMSRGGYEYATIGQNKNGDVALMLNDTNGVPVNDHKRDDKSGNVTIGNKALCRKLASLLDIDLKKTDYVVLKLKQIQKTDDFVAYIVTKKD